MVKPVTHVIFDMDGLILDTEGIYEKVINKIANKYGKEYGLDVQMKIRGTREPETAKIAVEDMGLPITVQEFLIEYTEMAKVELKNPPILPGAEKLINHLKSKNIPIAVATSSSRESMVIKTQNYQHIFSLFLHIVCGSSDPEVTRGKPFPDIFLICASKFPDQPAPENCLVFEDAPNGVTAALAAGMQAVMVPAKEVSEELRKHATMVLNSLEEFEPELFGLPAYDS